MDKVYDLIGLGFGPANLSLAIALQEREQLPYNQLETLFLEKKAGFDWFTDMLLPGATMQISFLKDLVTLRNPGSPYSFLNYLKQKNRLEQFINLRNWFPTRTEYHDYMSWVAEQFKSQVHYKHKVIRIEPADNMKELHIATENQGDYMERRFVTRNIVLALGGRPQIPSCVHYANNSQRVWHSSVFLSKIASYKYDAPHRFTVVGGGQSAAEICQYLHANYPRSEITVVMRGFGFRAADDSEYVNELFSSAGTERFHDAPHAVRGEILKKYANTNYTAVDTDLIKELYRLDYADRVAGNTRFNILNLSDLKEAREQDDCVDVVLHDRGNGISRIDKTDALILATGYERNNPKELLAPCVPFLDLDENGNLKIDRNYRVATKEVLHAGIYIQGASEETHGLSDTLLSVLPFRSAEVVDSLYEALTEETLQGHDYDVRATA